MKASTRSLYMLCLGMLVVGISCKKDREVANYDGDYTITGKVLDEITGAGIAGANVGVIERGRDATSNLGGKTVAFDKSDAEGNFTLTFYADSKQNNYELLASAPTYFEMTSGNKIAFTKNGSKNQNLSIIPWGYLVLHIKGNSGSYKLSINAGGGGANYFKGADTIVTYYKAPGKETFFVYGSFNEKDELLFKQDTTVLIPLPPDSIHYLIEF